MNYNNRHLSDLADILRAFIGYNYWHLLGNFGEYLAFFKRLVRLEERPNTLYPDTNPTNTTLTRQLPHKCLRNDSKDERGNKGAPKEQKTH